MELSRKFNVSPDIFKFYTSGQRFKSYRTSEPDTNGSNAALGQWLAQMHQLAEDLDDDPNERNTEIVWDRSKFAEQRRWYPEVFHPSSRMASLWIFVTIVTDALYSAFLLPIELAFIQKPNTWEWDVIVDMVAGTIFWFDIMMSFRTGFLLACNMKSKLVMNWRAIGHYYIMHGDFWSDFLSALSFIPELIIVSIPGARGGPAYRWILWIRALRLVRVVRLCRGLLASSLTQHYNPIITAYVPISHLLLISIVFMLAVLLNFMACLLFFVASLAEGGLESSWLATGTQYIDVVHAPAQEQYVVSLYFATTMMSTVGLGDFSASNIAECLVFVVVEILGLLLFAFMVTSSRDVVMFISTALRRAGALRGKMQDVELWAQHRSLCPRLQRRIRSYYSDIWVQWSELRQDEVFFELPAKLRQDIAFSLTSRMLRESLVFKTLGDKGMHAVAGRLHPVSLPPGHDICQENDPADAMWLLQEGEVQCIRGMRRVQNLKAPCFVGQVALLSQMTGEMQNRPCTFRTSTVCTLWTLKLSDLNLILDTFPELRGPLLSTYREHLRDMLSRSPHTDWESLLEVVTSLHERVSGVPNADDKEGQASHSGNSANAGSTAASRSGISGSSRASQHGIAPPGSSREQAAAGPEGHDGSAADDSDTQSEDQAAKQADVEPLNGNEGSGVEPLHGNEGSSERKGLAAGEPRRMREGKLTQGVQENGGEHRDNDGQYVLNMNIPL